jgi:hypothetical protein
MAVIMIPRGRLSHGKGIAKRVASALDCECVGQEILSKYILGPPQAKKGEA